MPYFMLFNIKYLDIAIFWKPSIVFFVKTLACLKYLRTFAPLLTKSTSEKKFWRGGRVVERLPLLGAFFFYTSIGGR